MIAKKKTTNDDNHFRQRITFFRLLMTPDAPNVFWFIETNVYTFTSISMVGLADRVTVIYF